MWPTFLKYFSLNSLNTNDSLWIINDNHQQTFCGTFHTSLFDWNIKVTWNWNHLKSSSIILKLFTSVRQSCLPINFYFLRTINVLKFIWLEFLLEAFECRSIFCVLIEIGYLFAFQDSITSLTSHDKQAHKACVHTEWHRLTNESVFLNIHDWCRSCKILWLR